MEPPGRTIVCAHSGTPRFRHSLPPHTTPPPARATAALRVAEPADRLLCESTPESPARAVYDPSAEAAATSAPAACTSLFARAPARVSPPPAHPENPAPPSHPA